jgi:hypothetical protein|uniref:Uncharacterized protein n=1 Tax=Oryza nivara TaxID=4536 RepID=A0A0E0GY34_ORYNI
MLEVDEEEPEWLTMTSADDEVVDVQTAIKTTEAEKLRSEDNTVVAPCRCNGEKSTGDVAMLRRVALSIAKT